MRFMNRAASAATVLACTGLASAQWCDGTNGNVGNWCGAHFSVENATYFYDRAKDQAWVYWTTRWSNLRTCDGQPWPDVVSTEWRWFPIDLPFRSCQGTTPVPYAFNGFSGVAPPCPGWGEFRNIDVHLSEYTWIYNAPPATAGTYWIAIEPCPGEPGKTRMVARTRNFPAGAGLNYSVSIERLCAAASGPANERIGEFTRVTLGPNDSAPVSPCANARTTSIFRVVETCGGVTQQMQNFTLHKSTGGTTVLDSPDYSSLRNAIDTSVLTRHRPGFRVRTPSAVMGVRGFTAAETVLTGYLDDPSLQVRWQRILDSAEPQNGVMPIELLEDGPLVGGSAVTGTHGPVLRLTGFTEHDAGTYLMRVIPAGGTIEESEIATTVHVEDDVGQPFFTQEPLPMRVCPSQLQYGAGPAFTVAAASTDAEDPISYTWYLNGQIAESNISDPPPRSRHFNAFGDILDTDSRICTPNLPLWGVTRAAADVHNLIWWVECEVSNSHGSTRSRAVPLVIDFDTDDCDADGTTDACEIAAGEPDANDDGIPDACQCLADVDGNHAIDGADLGLMLSQWGPTQPTGIWFRCDLNADGRVDGADLGVLLSGWGACGN